MMASIPYAEIRRLVSTWDDERLIARKEKLEAELEDGRNTTSTSDVGQSHTSHRLVSFQIELRAVLDEGQSRGLWKPTRMVRQTWGYVTTSPRDI